MPLKYSTPPSNQPIELQELKDHLNIGSTTRFDSRLQLMIDAVYDKADINCPAQYGIGQQLIEATLVFTLEELPRPKFELPRPPLISVTSLEYRAEDGTWQAIAASNYEVNSDAEPGFIYIDSDYDLPDLYEDEPYPIRVTYKAGYQGDDGSGGTRSTHEEVPANIRLYLMNVIGDFWMHRSTQVITSMDITELKASLGRLIASANRKMRFG